MPEQKKIPEQSLPPSRQPETPQQPRGRLFVLKLAFAVFFIVIAGRLIHIQVIEASKYQTIARKQYEQTFILPSARGNMYDRNVNVLASNSMYVSFAADPKVVADNATDIAVQFSGAFGKPRSFYLSKLHSVTTSGAPKRFVWLERRVPNDIAKRLESRKLIGVVAMDEAKRLYHYDEVAGTLIGFTDVDNKGISGLEFEFDEYLRGKDGSVVMQRDGLGRARPSVDYPRLEPRDGNSIVLTIDLAYQSIVEEELKRGVAVNKAAAGLAVMLNPKTGEILALANFPGLNPNDPNSFDVNAARNRVVTDVFEPGSVFKIVTASAGYENGLVTPEKKFYAEHGKYVVATGAKGKPRTISDTHPYDWITFQEAIELSSNIVMAKLAPTLGPERLYVQARNFGFGIPSGVDLPGEVRGRLKKPNEWSGTTLQTLAYGYEVAVTPLQIACAYAAVANKGILMRPYIISKIQDNSGEVLRENKPQLIRKVISEQTAALLTQAFEGVVERGTAKETRIQGVRIAGKTGTSRKVIDGHYGAGSYTGSFVGFFPVEDPQVVCLVMLDNPRGGAYYGGLTSGPVFRSIAERIINTTGRFTKKPQPKEQTAPSNGISVPDVRTLQVVIAGRLLEGHGLKSQTIGTGDIVVRQVPEPGKHVEKDDVVQLVLNSTGIEDANGTPTVPDVRGMSLRRAINRLVVDDFDIKVRGSGVVVEQIPAAGQKTQPGMTIRLVCEPKTIVSAVLY
ncbi:MAG: penicillin-binding transpeptidase domain-containing protein [Ignavibacteriales bacterium]|nr:penicillin-binding transpeptidase domain-containing protein [Ignavibacteriales bacterium]